MKTLPFAGKKVISDQPCTYSRKQKMNQTKRNLSRELSHWIKILKQQKTGMASQGAKKVYHS